VAAHHFADPAAAVREMARVSAGRVLIVDNLYLDEGAEEADKLRDPSHVRADRLRALPRAGRLHRRGRRARPGAARRPDQGRVGHARPHRAENEQGRLMPIIVDSGTRLVVQGLTGREGSFHALRNRTYGTSVVAGVTPGKGGQEVEGIPVFNTVAEAVDVTGANTTMVFVPAAFAADAIYEAVDAGIETVVCIAEGLPAHEMLRIYAYIRPRGVTMIGPNCPGALSPGQANVGIIPGEIFREGRVGLVSRSGTLTYQIGHELTQLGLGNSTIVGIGGDPVVGSSFIDVLGKFETDAATEVVVLVGEIGGDEEEKAARFIEAEMSKPVLAYIAGFTAPPGKTMGHAGAIISGSAGTAEAKKAALEACGVRVGTSPTEVAQLVAEVARP
jgi:succinyl-CoA synthetase alpha subunit